MCCLFYVNMNIYFYSPFNIARDVVTVLLLFVDEYLFHYTFIHAHIYYRHNTQAHIIGIISTQEELREPGTGA